jgi:hypothetical protein
MKRTKKPISKIDDLSYEEFYLKVMRCPEPAKSYLCALWLFGNRVSELLGIRARIKVGEYTYFKTNKRGETKVITIPKYRTVKDPHKEGMDEWVVKPIRRLDVITDTKKPIIRFVNVHTLKREGRPTHTYIARIDDAEEYLIWEVLQQYIETRKPEEPLWNKTRQWAWFYCNKYLGVPPHKLRGLRASRDAVEFNLDAIDLQNKFNWADASMPLHYARKNTRELEDKYLREQR